MRRLNLSTTLSVAGNATSGAIAYSGLTSPTVTEVGDNPDVSVASDGAFTLASQLVTGSEVVTVKVQDAAGYFIQGPVTIQGNGSGVNVMKLGLNLAGVTTYNGAFPFANLCYSMDRWYRSVGSGSFTQDQGLLTASVGTNEFRAYISDQGYGLPAGTYTVYNPSGAEVGIGAFGDQRYHAYTTATEFTFTLGAGNLPPTATTGLYLHCRGSLGNGSGNLAIILPGHTASWAAGNKFNSSFLSFLALSNPAAYRFMDWVNASWSCEVDWADRTLPTKINFYNDAAEAVIIPHEVMIDLCNRTGVNPWVNVPARATPAYCSSMAVAWAAGLDAALEVYLEGCGNEIWNWGSSWAENNSWIEHDDFTKLTATYSGSNIFTRAGHGFSGGEHVRCYRTKTTRSAHVDYSAANSWKLLDGNDSYIERIDADTFRLRETVGGTVLTIPSNMNTLTFLNLGEAGKSPNNAANYADKCVVAWDAFDAAFGAGRVKRIIASQSADQSVTANRFARLTATGNASRADAVAVAPYWNGLFWGGRIVTASGQFTPTVWGSITGTTFRVCTYASGTTPSDADLLAGTGAINYQISSGYTNSAGWSAAGLVAITGLTNGVTYDVYFVAIGANSSVWKIKQSIVATASASTIIMTDTYANQAARGRLDIANNTNVANNHKAAAGGSVDVICYETGTDFNSDRPAEIEAWCQAYFESAECGQNIADGLTALAAEYAGGRITDAMYFSDCGTGSFSLADNYDDAADERYANFAAFDGQVVSGPYPTVSNVSAATIATEPSYPQVIHTFADPSLTYTIWSGNSVGNYDISGGALRLIAGTGFSWSVPTVRTVTILASNAYAARTFTVTFETGLDWYEAVAKFAWSGITDSDPAAMNPTIGGTLSLTGTAAVVASGMWDMNGTANYSSSATGSTAGNTPWLVAAVIDRDGSTTAFNQMLQFGNSSKMVMFQMGNGTASQFVAQFYQGSATDVPFAAGGYPSGKHVAWAFWDGTKVRAGYDQVENTAAAVTKVFDGGITQYVSVGSSCQMKVGAIQSVPKAGMTITDALAIVAKMQAHHSIP